MRRARPPLATSTAVRVPSLNSALVGTFRTLGPCQSTMASFYAVCVTEQRAFVRGIRKVEHDVDSLFLDAERKFFA